MLELVEKKAKDNEVLVARAFGVLGRQELTEQGVTRVDVATSFILPPQPSKSSHCSALQSFGTFFTSFLLRPASYRANLVLGCVSGRASEICAVPW